MGCLQTRGTMSGQIINLGGFTEVFGTVAIDVVIEGSLNIEAQGT